MKSKATPAQMKLPGIGEPEPGVVKASDRERHRWYTKQWLWHKLRYIDAARIQDEKAKSWHYTQFRWYANRAYRLWKDNWKPNV
jgi:hypothetical protein